jgi:hypothetical protein
MHSLTDVQRTRSQNSFTRSRRLTGLPGYNIVARALVQISRAHTVGGAHAFTGDGNALGLDPAATTSVDVADFLPPLIAAHLAVCPATIRALPASLSIRLEFFTAVGALVFAALLTESFGLPCSWLVCFCFARLVSKKRNCCSVKI